MTAYISKLMALVLCIATFVLYVSAQDLAFTAPNLAGGASFTRGQQVTIQWTTPYSATTLSVLQDQGNGQYDSVNLLAASYSQSQTSFVWTAGPVTSGGDLTGQYHFFLNNANDPNCTGCFVNSAQFTVDESTASSSSSASSTTTPAVANTQSPQSSAAGSGGQTQNANSSPASASQTNGPSSSQATAAGAASTDSASGTKQKSGQDLGIPLGVGLGAGIPVFLSIVGLFFLWLFRRRNQKRRANERALEKQTSDSSPNTSGPSTWSEEAQRKEMNRESGALGPWAYGYHEDLDEHPWVQQQRQYQQVPARKRVSSQKYAHMPFRPSMATTAEESEDPPRTAESQRSWIEPFDFQNALARDRDDEDEMSQLQRTIDNEDDRSQYSTHSDRSVGGLPEAPQAVHHTYPDNSWPLRDRL